MQSLPFIDIIVFAIIAIFLIFRLKNILGEKTGYDPKTDENKSFKKDISNVVDFTKKTNSLRNEKFGEKIKKNKRIG